MPKICDIPGVREYGEGYPVELWRNDETGRLVVRATNEGGHNATEVDLLSLIEWCQKGQGLQEGIGITHMRRIGDGKDEPFTSTLETPLEDLSLKDVARALRRFAGS